MVISEGSDKPMKSLVWEFSAHVHEQKPHIQEQKKTDI